MHVSDDLYLGGFTGTQGLSLFGSAPGLQSDNPTAQLGAGPAGRTFFLNAVPLALATTNVAALQAPTSGTALTLTAGTGVTAVVSPAGTNVILFDVPRAVSLSSVSNLSAINFLVTGYDWYWQLQTQLITGPNNNTVTSLKAFRAIQSVVPQGTSASTVSVGTSDIFGLPWYIADAGYILSAKWANVLAQNAGTFVAGVATVPNTNLLGDVRGTFAQSGAASNGSNRLVIGMHLTGGQVGSNPTIANLIGVTPA